MNQSDSKNKIKLTNCKVLFHTKEGDEKAKEFGTSITIDVTDTDVRQRIVDFYKENKVGKNGDPNKGVAKITPWTNDKTGETVHQFTVKYNKNTKFGGLNGLSQEDIVRGSRVNLIASAYPYSKYGGGIAVSLSAVIVTSAGSNNEADFNELMGDLGGEELEDTDVVPF